MFTEPACDDGNLWIVFERLEHRGGRRGEWECTLVDQKRVLFVYMGIRLTKPNGVLCKCTKCFVIRVMNLVDFPQRAGRSKGNDGHSHRPILSTVSSIQSSASPSSSRSSLRSNAASANAESCGFPLPLPLRRASLSCTGDPPNIWRGMRHLPGAPPPSLTSTTSTRTYSSSTPSPVERCKALRRVDDVPGGR